MRSHRASTHGLCKGRQLQGRRLADASRSLYYSTLLLFGILLSLGLPLSGFAADDISSDEESVFLVATNQLHGTSFEQTVILLTHYSKQGSTGLTINRPTDILLTEVLPNIQPLQQRKDLLYLGGPVSPNAIFVLLRTLQPSSNMHRIGEDIYFSTGKHAFTSAIEKTTPSGLRTYAGYAGWGAGQLQREIDRGDWLMVHTHPRIIFEKDTESLWQRLSRRWSGKWI